MDLFGHFVVAVVARAEGLQENKQFSLQMTSSPMLDLNGKPVQHFSMLLLLLSGCDALRSLSNFIIFINMFRDVKNVCTSLHGH